GWKQVASFPLLASYPWLNSFPGAPSTTHSRLFPYRSSATARPHGAQYGATKMMNLGRRTVSPLTSVRETQGSTALECWLTALTDGLDVDAWRSLSGQSGHASWSGFDPLGRG